jgi:hypothetical protein
MLGDGTAISCHARSPFLSEKLRNVMAVTEVVALFWQSPLH